MIYWKALDELFFLSDCEQHIIIIICYSSRARKAQAGNLSARDGWATGERRVRIGAMRLTPLLGFLNKY